MEAIIIKNTGKIIIIFIFLGLVLTLNTSFATSDYSTNKTLSKWEGSENSNMGTAKNSAASSNSTLITIKVLIYNGVNSAPSCVSGIKTSLTSVNSKKLTPGYNFTYGTSTRINQQTLNGYDVLVMPGGSSGYNYIHSNYIDETAIKNFVKNGKGYLGICAGAYSAVYQVYDFYYGWGLASHVRATHPYYEGELTVKFTTKGQQILNTTGTVTMAHYNGPAMYISSPAMTFATYADNIINSNGMAAIVGDYYGNGRVVLSGPHPELDPQLPNVVAQMLVWAANKSKPDPKTVSTSQIASAAATVKTYYEKNKALPTSVTINGNKISMSQFAYLLGIGVVNVNNGSTTPILIKSVNQPPKPSGSHKKGIIYKATYVSLAKSLINFINTNGRTPNYLITPLGKMSFSKYIYMYSKIMNFFGTNKRLPNYVSM